MHSNETFRRELKVGSRSYDYYSLASAEELGLQGASRLPFCLKVVLENLLRQHAEGRSDGSDLQALAEWLEKGRSEREIGFRPTRVLMPDSSGIPLFGDLAAMRDAMIRLGGDPASVNPAVPVDLVVDHSVMVDEHATKNAVVHNLSIELKRNAERYAFLRWAEQAFDNLRLIPPGNGILHQINLEYLARVVWTRDEGPRTIAFPDSLLGMDSHTATINSLGVLAWGVGGLEGGAAALGETVSMLIPDVVGCKLVGRLRPGVTSTDLVLTVTQTLRRHNVVAKFVEYFGPGLDELSIPDRATVANMSPEYGANIGFFPIDAETLRFLRVTGREAAQVELVEAYAKAQGLWRDAKSPQASYTETLEIDLSTVVPSVSGPKRPQDRVALQDAPAAFTDAFPAVKKASSKGLKDGDVVIAAITSCTNTSNPTVMIGAGLLARNAVARGLKPKPWVKTSLSPGIARGRRLPGAKRPAGLARRARLPAGGLRLHDLHGQFRPARRADRRSDRARPADRGRRALRQPQLRGAHPSLARANFLASPPLVVAYALAGTVLTDLASEPLGEDRDGKPVYLREIWPDGDEIRSIIDATLTPALFRERYAGVMDGPPEWRAMRMLQTRRLFWKI